MRRKWVAGWPVILLCVTLLGCGSSDLETGGGQPSGQADAELVSVAELVGTEVKANSVVDLPCIPSRRDPVGVWLALRIDSAAVEADTLVLGLEETDARLGSHPSGCRAPEVLIAQSVFLLGQDDDPVFATSEALIDGVTFLEFVLEDGSEDYDLMIVPTFQFEKGNGDLETTIFGTIGRYSIDR